MTDLDERIAAYLDGSMSAEDAAQLEADMATDGGLRARVESWKGNDALIRQAFPVSAHAEPAMLERLGLADISERPAAANDNGKTWWRIGLAGGAIAASLALAVTLFKPTGPTYANDGQFQVALETLPSGQALAMGDGNMVRPVLSFAAGDGRYCREFVVGASQGGIACRTGQSWKVEAEAKSGGNVTDGGEIRTAAGADTHALDAAYARLNASDPFNSEKEKDAISRKWVK